MIEERAKILVVDDEPFLREMCEEALRDAGYDVLCAQDGNSALGLLREQSVDIVISDMRMPVLSGLDLLEHAKRESIEADFMLMTGYGTLDTAVQSIKLGAADYIAKPFDVDHLLIKIEKILAERRLRIERGNLSSLVRILDVCGALNTRLDLASLEKEFVFQLQQHFAIEGLALFLEERGVLRAVAVRGRSLREDAMLFKRVRDLCSEANVKGEARFADHVHGTNGESPSHFLLCAPLVGGKSRIGVVCLVRGQAGPPFGLADLQLLAVFATHAATAFDNATIYGRMRDMNMEIIRAFARAVEAKDIYTRGHSERVALLAAKLGRRLGLTLPELDKLSMAGTLHDIGKIGIPDSILNKPSSLTRDEYEVMKRHPVVGREILSQVLSLQDILKIIYHHHERMDGKGYPDGLRGDAIPFLARVISVVDGFEAMSSDRAYHAAFPLDKVVRIMKEGAGQQWDADILAVWLKLVESGEANV